MNQTNRDIKSEANDFLFNQELYKILTNFTSRENIFLSGSYVLDVMAWRDLDIFIDIKDITQDKVYDLISKVIKKYRPTWIESKDSSNEVDCPKGYFLGFETMSISDKLWNVDIWITNTEYIKDNMKYIEETKSKLNAKTRSTIIQMKQELIEKKQYGSKYLSIDIYSAVLDKGIDCIGDLD